MADGPKFVKALNRPGANRTVYVPLTGEIRVAGRGDTGGEKDGPFEVFVNKTVVASFPERDDAEKAAEKLVGEVGGVFEFGDEAGGPTVAPLTQPNK